MKNSPSSQDKANTCTGKCEAQGWTYTHGKMGATKHIYSQSKQTNGDKSGDGQTPAERHKQTALPDTCPAHLEMLS